MDAQQTFDAFQQRNWSPVFQCDGSGDWTGKFYLDGEKATLKPTEKGIIFAAGPIAKDNASHAVLWTKDKFDGDVKVDFDFTRFDTINRYVNIIYFQARGDGDNPEDIHSWRDQREIPFMSTYFNNMNLLHVSYAAFGNDNDDPEDYIRVRRYPVRPDRSFAQMEVEPTYFNTELFQPGFTYHMCFIKTDECLALQVSNDNVNKVFTWNLADIEPVTNGPIGIRHMFCKCSRYKDFTVSQVG